MNNKMKTFGALLLMWTFSCQSNGSDSGRPVQILSSIASQQEVRALSGPLTPLSDVRFLQLNGSTKPSSMAGAGLYWGDRASDGTIIWTAGNPFYDGSGKNAYFVAYHPAIAPAAVESPGTVVWTIDGATDILLSSVFDAGTSSTPIPGNGQGETPLTFGQKLAQLALVFKAEVGADLIRLRSQYGNITQVKFLDAPTQATYTYSDNMLVFGGPSANLNLWQEDCQTAFASIEIPPSDHTDVDAAGLFAPAAGTFRIEVSTALQSPIVVPIELPDMGGSYRFDQGIKYIVSVVFKPDGSAVAVAEGTVEGWIPIYTANTEVEV